MKHFTLSLAIIFLSAGQLMAQVASDSVSTMPGNTSSVFYKLSDGSQTSVSNSDWHLAFDVSQFGASIRANIQTGMDVYLYSGDTSTWSAVLDTAGINSWDKLYNSDAYWFAGAFEMAAGMDPFDVGWGMYNPSTHVITGNRIYVIKLPNGELRKLWFQNLLSGVYNFRIGDISGSMDMTYSVTKADFAGKNFGYFSFTNGSSLDREPMQGEWDLLFQKYMGDLGPGGYYGVTGVLSNAGVYVSEASGVDVNNAFYTDYTSDSLINTIGYDWKEFDMSTFQYTIADDLCYFVQDRESNIWKLLMTGYGGSATGQINFSKELISAVSIEENINLLNVAVYPNPSIGGDISLVFNLESDQALVQIFDLSGRIIGEQSFQGRGFKQRRLNLDAANAGTYILRLVSGKSSITKKIIIQ
jgi:hypothetical protein